ncbi:MAG: class D beta-lactamase [Siphonobacter aquaeclarae]|nr:class D beta-lactamase [Siphonobacter aquaeclarae]
MMKKILCLMLLAAPVFGQAVTERDFRKYFDARQVTGSFLLLDLKKNQYTAYDAARCRKGFLPASTFKIPNTLIAFETGIIRDTSYVFHWEGKKWPVEAWNRDMSLPQAIAVSCVPCFQQIARKVGAYRYQTLLGRMQYGHFQVPVDSVEWFWLQGGARISQFEQVDFLKRFYLNQLPVNTRSAQVTKALLLLGQGNGWKLRGKTGWASPTLTGAEGWGDDPNDYGWFVGWIEQGGDVYVFATQVEAKRPVPDSFGAARRAITEAILRDEFGLMK